MILRYPSYYDQFSCIADRCEDTCCAGWEVDIDDESYRYYQSVPGEFGERLRASIKKYGGDGAYEEHGFILKNRRCPFLNEENLCEIYMELGEDSLCSVCANTPRNILEYGGQRELAVSASCPEAGRLIYGKREKTTFVEKEMDEELDFEETSEEMAFARWVRRARDKAIRILQDRDRTIEERIRRYLGFSVWVQDNINGRVYPEEMNIDLEKICCLQVDEVEDREIWSLLARRVLTFSRMESIREVWEQTLEMLNRCFVQPEDGRGYRQAGEAWAQYQKQCGREYEYEHLLVYYVFMCQSRCVDDYDFLGKTRLVLVSFLMIRDMDILTFQEKGEFSLDDRVRNVRIYAREVEHSEENLDYLADEFLFDETYSVENLAKAVIC